MIRALFFDLDGTLLTSRKTLADSTRAALRQCQKQGIRIFLVTARAPLLDKMLGWTEAGKRSFVSLTEESIATERVRSCMDKLIIPFFPLRL